MQGIRLSVNYVGAHSDIALIMISGYVDTTTCQELAKVIQELRKRKCYQIITDLGNATYISSAGWGVFMGEIKNIRERGGDIKVVQMTPEVTEVFEMLEFNRILNCYDSIEEAIDEIDLIRGIDITTFHEKNQPSDKKQESPVNVQPINKNVITNVIKKKVDTKDLPLMEKIKIIVLENPFLGLREIHKTLNSEKYGYIKMNYLKLRSTLCKLSLETKQKRYRFYRSR